MVQHVREHGEQEAWSGELFTYYVIDGMKYWSMGSDVVSTVILNRKPWGQDPGDREKGAEAPAAVPKVKTSGGVIEQPVPPILADGGL